MNDTTKTRLIEVFAPDGRPEGTVGVEEELMLLDTKTLDLAPRAADVLARVPEDPRFKPELPAAQLESLTSPVAEIGDLADELRAGREDLAAAAEGLGLLACAGAHPFTAAEGELNQDPVYEYTREEYGPVARRQLVFGLHVHVRVAEAARAVAVYDALRGYLGEIAAIAANAPLRFGRDSGMASVRPKIAEMLPRQGVPPAFGSVDAAAAAFDWAAASGTVPEPRMWWWELRLHPIHGTLEVRAPDQQTTIRETVAIAGFIRALILELAERHDAGEPLQAHPAWRIAENRWSAARHGLEGQMADLESGERRPTRERLLELIEGLARSGRDDGWAAAARELATENGASRQLAAAASGGAVAAARELVTRFLD